MRENFDYVTMDAYNADMKESADRAVSAINHVRKRAEHAEWLLDMVLISIGHDVRIDKVLAVKLRPGEPLIEFEQHLDEANDQYVIKARWKL